MVDYLVEDLPWLLPLTPPLSWKPLSGMPLSAPKRPREVFDRAIDVSEECQIENSVLERMEVIAGSLTCMQDRTSATKKRMLGWDVVGEEKVSPRMERRRPARIAIPESCMSLVFGEGGEVGKELGEKEVEVEGGEYCLASRKGSRHAVMEDGYGAITSIQGDSKQAFFAVFDGHGGRTAVDFVADKLGKNILAALSDDHQEEEEEEEHIEMAVIEGYLTTDKEFLSQGVSSGTCAATVLLKNGELHVANVGDCRVVISRRGVADALTIDHRPGRHDERARIENSGGYVSCNYGVWRVHDTLAVSRAFGDASMKEWIISEPETKKLRLTQDCEFLIMASDGLWDKVNNQEAIDVVSRCKSYMQSCKDLVEMALRRGSRDDVTVMVVDLQRFLQVPQLV